MRVSGNLAVCKFKAAQAKEAPRTNGKTFAFTLVTPAGKDSAGQKRRNCENGECGKLGGNLHFSQKVIIRSNTGHLWKHGKPWANVQDQ
jgi:hypothetical protein